jgi:uncharacterized protein YqeY
MRVSAAVSTEPPLKIPCMGLKEQLQQDMKTALKAGEKDRLGVVRMALAAVKQVEIDTRQPLDDGGVLAALQKMVKQRRDSLSQFRAAGRDDLADKEQAEIDFLTGYLPSQLDETALDNLIDQIIADVGASSPADMGKVMGALKAKAAGQVDMGAASARVKARLLGS